jgi:hypothetical protein
MNKQKNAGIGQSLMNYLVTPIVDCLGRPLKERVEKLTNGAYTVYSKSNEEASRRAELAVLTSAILDGLACYVLDRSTGGTGTAGAVLGIMFGSIAEGTPRCILPSTEKHTSAALIPKVLGLPLEKLVGLQGHSKPSKKDTNREYLPVKDSISSIHPDYYG